MKRFYIRYRKWLLALLIAGVLAVLYLPVERAFLRYTDKLVREILTNLVETQSKGVYYVNYKSLKFNVFTQKLKLYDFNMYPKDTSNLTLDTNATKNKFYYGISIEEFELELNREWDIFISKELSVHQATFRNPRVKVLNQRVQKMHYEMGEISGELYDAVTSYLSAFRLSDVDFIDARMDYYLNTKEFFRVLRFNEFSIKIRDLDISEERRKNQNRILFADDFELTSKHQSFYLEDSTHSVSFDKFHVSIRKKQLSFNNLRISPNEPDSNPKVNHLTLFAPEIKLSDVDFERFYLKNELIIARLFVDRPVGKYDIFTLKAAKKETPDTSKIKLFNVLTTTKVHQLMLNRGSISVNRFSKIKTDNYTVKGISFRLQDFFLDSNIINENRYFDARRNFRISVDEISHEIPEEGLSVKIGRTEYSSLTKVLDCAGIRIIPNEKIKKKLLEKREKKWYLEEFSVKAIHATRLDLEELERDNSLRIKRLEVLRPYLKMGYDTAHLANQMKMSSKTFNDILSQYIDTGQVGFIKVLGAKVDIVNTRKEENVFCSSTNIDIWVDDLNTLKFKYGRKYLIDLMSHSALSAGNTIWNFPQANERFNFSNFDYSSSRNKLFIANLRSKYKDQQTEVVLEVSEFDTKGLNWDEIINKRQLNLKKAVLVNPKVTVKIPNTQGNVATGFTFESYKIDSLKIANASLKLEKDKEVPVLFENLFFNATDFTKTANSNRVGYETISGKLKNGRFLVDKGRHSLDLKNVSYDSQDFLFDEIVMEPLLRNRDPDEKTVVKTKLLNGEFKNFNFDPDNEKMFRFSKGSICEAESFISLITGDNPSHLKEKLNQIHVELLEKLGWNVGKFDTLKVEKGTFRLTTLNHQTGEKNTLQVPQYSLAIHGFQLSSKTPLANRNLFFSKNVSLDAYFVQHLFSDSLNSFKADHFQYGSRNGEVTLTGVDLAYMLKDENKNNKLFVEGQFSEIGIKGLKPIDIIKNRRLQLDRIYLESPNLDITQFHKETPVVSREMALNSEGNMDSNAVSKLLIKEFRLKEGDVKWTFSDTLKQPLRFKRVDVKSEQLAIAKNTLPQFQTMELSFGDFRHEVLKGFYELSFEQLAYSSTQQTLHISHARMEPQFGIFEFAREAGWERTRLELYVENIKLLDWDLMKSVNNHEMRARQLLVDSMWVRSFKNKQLPMIERYMPMPQELLLGTPFPLKLDSATLTRGYVQHNQLAKNGIRPGRIIFTDLNANLSNITNIESEKKKDQSMKLAASTKLMGMGLIKANFDFNLNSEHSSYSGEAKLIDFDPTLINNFTENIAFVRIRSGYVKEGNLSFTANRHYGMGDAVILYDNLYIDFLNKSDPDKQGMGVIMKNFLANRVVNTKNPHFFITKKGDIFSRRDSTRAIFNYWAKLSMSGVVSGMGVRDKRIKKLKKEQIRKENAILRDEEDGLQLESLPIAD